MNQEEIIAMAREVGFDDYEQDEMLARFAALVAAKAVLDERDALCDIVDEELNSSGHALSIKLAVRARG